MSEETDALSNRIRQLESQVADMQRLLTDTSDLLDIARANGLDKFLTGHGLYETQGGIARTGLAGIQLLNSNTSGEDLIHIVKAFYATPSDVPSRSVRVGGYEDGVETAGWFVSGEGSSTPGALSGNQGRVGVYSDSQDVEAYLQTYDGTTNVKVGIVTFNGNYAFVLKNAALQLTKKANDTSFGTAFEGYLFTRSDTHKVRYYDGTAWKYLATESYVIAESASAAAVASSGTITTASVTSARVAPTGAVTGVILQSGTAGGQVCTVVNESAAANTVTFAASGTSHVADGTSSVVAGLTARRFVWDSGTSLWYPCK